MKDKILKQFVALPTLDKELFNQAFSDIVPIKQDKIPPQRFSSKNISLGKRKNSANNKQLKQVSASFVFSDGFEAYFNPDEKIKYVRPGTETQAIKRLARGDYVPEFLLDLHGLKQEDAKLEIAALLHAAYKQHVNCVSIMHGIGKHILKKSVPNWLIQHPNVLGFHQAPKEWGGKSALLVLLDVPTNVKKETS
jgi:DNA-nicking Smr family endonuclease